MSGNRFKLIDLIVSCVIVVFIASLSVANLPEAVETARRIKCQSNLRQIGQAMLLYANDNRGAYPRTIWAQGDGPTPTWGTPYQTNSKLAASTDADPFVADGKPGAECRPQPNDVTAAMYLLMRTEDITSTVFACPSSDAARWDFGGGTNTALNWTNWRGNSSLAAHLSYSFNNPYFSNKAMANGLMWTSSIGADYALAGDLNPGSDDLMKLTSQSPMADIRLGNSPNHFQDGQNVLFGDGHVEFDSSPIAGAKRDNIYTFEAKNQSEFDKSASAGIIGAPVAIEDSVLLPTAKSIGNVLVQPVPAEQAAAVRKKLAGNYSRHFAGGVIHLTLTESTFSEQMPGLVAVAYTYVISGTVEDRLRVTITSADTQPSVGWIEFTGNGIEVSKIAAFSGDWTKD